MPLTPTSSLLKHSHMNANSWCTSSRSQTSTEEYKLVNIPARRTPMVLKCCGVNMLIVRLSSSQMRKIVIVSLASLGRVPFLIVFFLLFLKKNKCFWLGRGRWRISQSRGPQQRKYCRTKLEAPERKVPPSQVMVRRSPLVAVPSTCVEYPKKAGSAPPSLGSLWLT